MGNVARLSLNYRWRAQGVEGYEMADQTHLDLLNSGIAKWNSLRPAKPDLSSANLFEAQLRGADLRDANLRDSDLRRANLREARLERADLRNARLYRSNLNTGKLNEANLSGADLERAFLSRCDLSKAILLNASLKNAILVRSDLTDTILTGASVYGVSTWDLEGLPKNQDDLVITPTGQTEVTVDNLKVAQFIYLLLENAQIRDVIDTVGKKGVLILGRFTDRKAVLNGLRTRFRELGFVPMVFDFERPNSKDLSETVKTLAGLSAFIVADLTAPRSTPHEAQAIVPEYMVPFVPIIQSGEEPYAMFNDLWLKHEWVIDPLEYSGIEALLPKVGTAIVEPAMRLRQSLLDQRTQRMDTRSLDDYD